MQGNISDKIKRVILVCFGIAFIVLMGWNARLQAKVDTLNENKLQSDNQDHTLKKRSVDDTSGTRGASRGGAVFIRWGKSECPNEGDNELIYKGIMGGSHYTQEGGGSDVVCLPRTPKYATYTDTLENNMAYIYGAEFENPIVLDKSNSPSGKLHDNDIQCAVCFSRSRASQIMIPARDVCYDGWKLEYWGYLMTSHYAHKAQHPFLCVDNAPEGDERSVQNNNGVVLYHVQGVCGSLPCPHYVEGRELTCAVCTR